MKEVRQLILELSRQRGVTIFLSSHLLYEVELIATQMAIIHQGKLRAAGSVRELLKEGPSSVLIKTDRPEALLGFLKGEEAYRSAIAENDGIQVEIDLEQIPELNRWLVHSGFNVHALVPRRTLETYFLDLIREQGS